MFCNPRYKYFFHPMRFTRQKILRYLSLPKSNRNIPLKKLTKYIFQALENPENAPFKYFLMSGVVAIMNTKVWPNSDASMPFCIRCHFKVWPISCIRCHFPDAISQMPWPNSMPFAFDAIRMPKIKWPRLKSRANNYFPLLRLLRTGAKRRARRILKVRYS